MVLFHGTAASNASSGDSRVGGGDTLRGGDARAGAVTRVAPEVPGVDRGDPATGPRRSPGRRLRRAYLVAAWAFVVVAVLVAPTAWPVSKVVAATLALLASPLAVYPTRRPWPMATAFWIASFLTLQIPLSRLVLDPDTRTLPPNLDIVLDVRGGIPGIEGPQHVTTDEHGFRARPPVDYRSREALRIFAIGGSTTEQLYLDDRATWTYLLQERLARRLDRRVEVVNAGVSGLRARHHLATLEHVLPLRPDLVLFLVGANDWIRQIFDEHGAPARRRCLVHPCFDETLVGRAVARAWAYLRAPGESGQQVHVDHGEYFAGQRRSLSRPDRREFLPQDVSEDYKGTLERIYRECREKSLRCVLVTQPNGYSVTADPVYVDSFWATPPNTDYTLTLRSMIHIARLYNSFLVSFARARGLPLCDLAPEIPASHDAFYDEMHFNTRGAALVAEKLESCVGKVLEAADLPPSGRT